MIEKVSSEEAKNLDIDKLLVKLGSSEKGITNEEAKKRAEKYGYNELKNKISSPLIKFLKSFWGPIPAMIEVAIVLSAIIKAWEDFWIILVLLFLNVTVSFWQEYKASNAIELLKKKLALKAKVFRNGEWVDIVARDLVPGDVIRIRLGDIVPADAKLIGDGYILADESTLTGESLPSEKHFGDMAYSGAVVKQGEMNAVVVTTGMNTYFGRTTKLVEKGKNQSHFQKAIIKIANYLIVVAVILVAIIFAIAMFRHEGLLQTLHFAMVLTIASVPVALPAVLSVTMAVGAVALTKKDAIVSRLVSIEEMAGMDVLCSDKTGTITKNELSVTSIKTFGKNNENDVLVLGILSSREEDQDPIDNAVFLKAKKIVDVKSAASKYKKNSFKPFDPVSKRTEAAVEKNGKTILVSKGAPQAILALLNKNDKIDDEVKKTVDDFAQKGYRALGVAKKEGDSWEYVGILALSDLPRDDSKEMIEAAKQMGIDVKMVTGDHIAIAKNIANSVNLGNNIIAASEFVNKPDEYIEGKIEGCDGFAEVFPEHKYKIVRLLQKLGHIVGMTGDGVNDAPALKRADAGIAVEGATDAAKSAADLVLTKSGLSVIIDAIKESRNIFQRMKHYSIYRIAETIRIIFFIALSIIVFNFYPVTAIMIVLLALLNDGAILSMAYDNTKHSDKPEKWNLHEILAIATTLGLFGVVQSFALFYVADSVFHLPRALIQSLLYLKLSVAGHFMVFHARTKGSFWKIKPAKIMLGAVIVTQIIATLIVVNGVFMEPIGWKLAGIVWAYAAVTFLIMDALKILAYKIIDWKEAKKVADAAPA